MNNIIFYKKNQLFIDLFLYLFTFIISFIIKFGINLTNIEPKIYIESLFILIFINLFTNIYRGIYTYSYQKFSVEFLEILKSNFISIILFLSILYLFKIIHVSREFIILYFIISFIGLLIQRFKKYKLLIKENDYTKENINKYSLLNITEKN